MSVEKKNSKSEVSFAKLTSLRIIRLTFLVTFPRVFAVCIFISKYCAFLCKISQKNAKPTLGLQKPSFDTFEFLFWNEKSLVFRIRFLTGYVNIS